MDHSLETWDSFGALELDEDYAATAPNFLEDQGERRLLTALLQEAALTFKEHAGSETRRGKRLFREAEAWFNGSVSDAPVSFSYVCDVLDLEPTSFLAKLGSCRAKAVASTPRSAEVVALNPAGGNGTPWKARETPTGGPGAHPSTSVARFPKERARPAVRHQLNGNGRASADIQETNGHGVPSQNPGAVRRIPINELRTDMRETKTMTTMKRPKLDTPKLSEPGTGERVPSPAKRARTKHQFTDDALLLLGYIGMYPEGIHGYQLHKMLSQDPLELPSLPLGRLYRVLRRLEDAGLVASQVEADGGRLRYLFSVTPEGESYFREWLTSSPTGSDAVGSHVLQRLRFASLLSRDGLSRLFDDAETACRASLEALHRRTASDGGPVTEASQVYASAQQERLEDELRWLEKIRALAMREATEEDWQDEYVAATAVA
jgi:PadR family transcriptional regulator PadR